MQFQLVLQFAGDACPGFEDLVALEDELRGRVASGAIVDGHDIGSGEANIFILTPEPAVTFTSLVPVLREQGRLDGLRAAYRPLASDEYVTLWPEGSTAPFDVK